MWIEFGTINESKKSTQTEKKFFIKLEKGLVLTVTGTNFKGEKINRKLVGGEDCLNIVSRQDKIVGLAKGDESRIEELNDRIPEYIKYYISIPPEK